MDNAYFAACFRGAFNGVAKRIADAGHAHRERGVRLVAGDAAVESDLTEATREGEAAAAGEGVVAWAYAAGGFVGTRHIEQGEVPAVKAGARDKLDGALFSDYLCDG